MTGQVVNFLLSGLVGALVSLAILALRVLPSKVSRKDVQEMLENQPLQFQFQSLARSVDQGQSELRSIRDEIVGLRQDVTRLTTTLELVLKNLI